MTRITDNWLNTAATQDVCAALKTEGAQAYFVGGCVRNALLGAPVSDIDITTDARPEKVMSLAKRAGIKAVPTGIEHGTITLVHGGIPHEVTTFRRDVETDGRRAVVAYSDSIEEDASRRDFTMNALYADPDGAVLDPLGGLDDLRARRVRFIGTAQNRIREDYLRSLRYFRFHAWYGDADAGFDPDALSAIASNLKGLSSLSRERVGAELLKLLAAQDPAPSVAAMRMTGVLAQILPGSDDRALAPLIHLEEGIPPSSIRRLAALGKPEMAVSLRLSKAQMARLTRLHTASVGTKPAAELGFAFGEEEATDAILLRSALMETPPEPNWKIDIEKGSSAVFPVSAKDLMPEYSGRALGDKLAELKKVWIESGFALEREVLLKNSK